MGGDPIWRVIRRSRHALAGLGDQRHRRGNRTDAANDYRIKEEPMFAEASLAAWVL